jgi:ABC-type phosphate/phosphonate transport system substrate-binding protein
MIGKITKAFRDMHKNPEGRKMLKILDRAQFTPATDATFDSLRKILAAKAKMKKKK